MPFQVRNPSKAQTVQAQEMAKKLIKDQCRKNFSGDSTKLYRNCVAVPGSKVYQSILVSGQIEHNCYIINIKHNKKQSKTTPL